VSIIDTLVGVEFEHDFSALEGPPPWQANITDREEALASTGKLKMPRYVLENHEKESGTNFHGRGAPRLTTDMYTVYVLSVLA
jgi:hypothetical protein